MIITAHGYRFRADAHNIDADSLAFKAAVQRVLLALLALPPDSVRDMYLSGVAALNEPAADISGLARLADIADAAADLPDGQFVALVAFEDTIH